MSGASAAGPGPLPPNPTGRTLPDLVSGGTPENRWEYRRSTQIYTRWWAVEYYGVWFDGERTRPVKWILDDCVRIKCGAMTMYKETWAWVYFDDINYHP